MVVKVLTSLFLLGAALPSVAEGLDLLSLMADEPKSSTRQPSVLEKGYVAPKVTVVRAVEALPQPPTESAAVVTNVVAEITNTVAAVAEITNVVETAVVDVATNTVAAVTNAVEEAVVPPVEALVERVAPTNRTHAAASVRTGRPARITSATTYYDRKEGVVFFDRNVYVDDEQYQLHADRAYVFISGTNDLRRIVALGNVSLTNDLRRAYGTKVSYYKEGGMVVLYGDAGRPAEVRDESKSEPQVVKGSKIKFWIDSEQVEVIDADITAPVSGSSRDFKQAIRRSK